MLERMVREEVVFYTMGILMTAAVFAKLISYFAVGKLVRAAKEIAKSNHRLIKLVRAKFEHASMVSDKVQNVKAFVDKYMYEYKVWGIRLDAWRLFPRKILWILGVLGAIAIFESYRIEGIGDLMIKYIQWTGLFILFLLLLCFVTDDTSRLDAARNYMVEYLENVCVHRYAKMNQEFKNAEEVSEESVDVQETKTQEEELPKEHAEERDEKSEQEMRIRAILEEFLT